MMGYLLDETRQLQLENVLHVLRMVEGLAAEAQHFEVKCDELCAFNGLIATTIEGAIKDLPFGRCEESVQEGKK